MAEFETVLYEKLGPVARVTLNRPERVNALSQQMLRELSQALDLAEWDDAVRALVVTGRGSAFSSGFDLKEQMQAGLKGVTAWRPVLAHDFATVLRFWRCPKPTIAAVRGACLAGACELALACDLTVASEDAFFGEPELKFGAGIVVMLLPFIVGPKIAKEIILTGEDRLDAKRARELGLVNRVVPAHELDAAALELARHLAVIDPWLMRHTKRAINRAYEAASMAEALQSALDIDLRIEGRGSPDRIEFMEIARREGLRAALAWRDARFAKSGRDAR
jgi:enoyl-CoA hydratase/carnithine racemase